MSGLVHTVQQRDPVGAMIGRPMTFIAAVGMPSYAAVMTWFNRADIVLSVLALLAILVVLAASVVLVRQSSPLRAPFTGRTHAVVLGLTVSGYVLSTASLWGGNQYIRDDWPPVVIGAALFAVSQYRPPKEIAVTGLALALLVGVVALVQAPALVTVTPPITIAIVSMVPLLAMSLASAAFGRFLLDGLLVWRRSARRAAEELTTDNTGWMTRSVQQDRVTILNREIVPFFAAVLNAGVISEADRTRARQIADDVRTVMITDIDRTWLDSIVDQLPCDVHDPHRAAVRMSTDQRTAMRAILVALATHPSASAQAVSVTIQPVDTAHEVSLQARFENTDNLQREFAPYIAVLRIVFGHLSVDVGDERLALRFSYEQR